jgi:hypothetical protein
MTGHWFELLAAKGKSRRKTPTSVSAAEIVQASIRRSKNPSTDAATPGEYKRVYSMVKKAAFLIPGTPGPKVGRSTRQCSTKPLIPLVVNKLTPTMAAD